MGGIFVALSTMFSYSSWIASASANFAASCSRASCRRSFSSRLLSLLSASRAALLLPRLARARAARLLVDRRRRRRAEVFRVLDAEVMQASTERLQFPWRAPRCEFFPSPRPCTPASSVSVRWRAASRRGAFLFASFFGDAFAFAPRSACRRCRRFPSCWLPAPAHRSLARVPRRRTSCQAPRRSESVASSPRRQNWLSSAVTQRHTRSDPHSTSGNRRAVSAFAAFAPSSPPPATCAARDGSELVPRAEDAAHVFLRAHAKAIDGTAFDFADLKGDVIMITPGRRDPRRAHYAELTALCASHGPRGLRIIGFPCNQFLRQENKSAAEIEAAARRGFDRTRRASDPAAAPAEPVAAGAARAPRRSRARRPRAPARPRRAARSR